jgi:ATP-dependent Clp protease ATP-binding subunit ClpC
MFERFTDRARRAVVFAQEESRALNHDYIGTEHLLLGLVREGDGVAARVLVSMGVDLNLVRAEVVRLLREYQARQGG